MPYIVPFKWEKESLVLAHICHPRVGGRGKEIRSWRLLPTICLVQDLTLGHEGLSEM